MEKSRNAHNGRNARARQRVAGPGDVAGGQRVSTGPADTYVGGFRRPARPAGDGQPSASSHSHPPYPFSWSRAGAGKISLGASGERKTEREPIGRTLGSVQRLFRGKKRERRGAPIDAAADDRRPPTRAPEPLPVLRVSGICLFRGERGLARAPFFFLAVWLIARSI